MFTCDTIYNVYLEICIKIYRLYRLCRYMSLKYIYFYIFVFNFSHIYLFINKEENNTLSCTDYNTHKKFYLDVIIYYFK